MKKIISVFLGAIICAIFFIDVYAEEVSDMKAVMIIASSNFRDEELFDTKDVLEKGGVRVAIASSSLAPSRGMLGRTAKPDILVSDIKVPDYDAVIFVGGIGAQEYWNNPLAHKIVKDAVSAGKVVAAICIAPVTLANAGVLNGKKATSWPSEGAALKSKGANYTKRSVEVDGKIVTADGPQSAREFGSNILEALK